MMLASTLFESGYWSEKPLRPNARGNFCHAATMSASALKGDSPFSSRSEAASKIFSGTVHSAIVVTLHPNRCTRRWTHEPFTRNRVSRESRERTLGDGVDSVTLAAARRNILFDGSRLLSRSGDCIVKLILGVRSCGTAGMAVPSVTIPAILPRKMCQLTRRLGRPAAFAPQLKRAPTVSARLQLTQLRFS